MHEGARDAVSVTGCEVAELFYKFCRVYEKAWITSSAAVVRLVQEWYLALHFHSWVIMEDRSTNPKE